MTHLWSHPDIPQKGWSCIEAIDLEDAVHACQMCGGGDEPSLYRSRSFGASSVSSEFMMYQRHPNIRTKNTA
jgi:hypothetical protein